MDQPSKPLQSLRQLRLLAGKSNPFKALVLLFVLALCFIIFQMTVLSSFQETEQIMQENAQIHHKQKRSNHESSDMKEILAKLESVAVPGPEILREINPKFAKAFRDEVGIKVNGTLLRGVMKAHRKFYVPTNGLFTCLSGNQTVPWKAVNNDECDCLDGSDEPGTSACKNGRFYCEPELHFISSTRVNDGICDCCDGSDEWKGVTAPPNRTLDASSRLAPCTDVCMDYAHSKVRELNLIKEGSIAKQRYLELGAAHAEGGKFGARGEFYQLSLSCFNFRSPSYVYEICPFVNATQSGKDVWVIGSGGRLEGTELSGYKLIMEDGDGAHCPDGKKRKTIISFNCASTDAIKFISEKDTCAYAAKFSSPVACPDST